MGNILVKTVLCDKQVFYHITWRSPYLTELGSILHEEQQIIQKNIVWDSSSLTWEIKNS